MAGVRPSEEIRQLGIEVRGGGKLTAGQKRALQRFLSAFSEISTHFRPRRHRLAAEQYRREMTVRFTTWNQVTGLTTAA
jgi:hypothetical protein